MTVLERLQLHIKDADHALLEDCIESAQSAIMNRRYPYGTLPKTFDSRYNDLLFRCALDLYNKIGAQGQLAHSENGISRTYESSWISAQLLSEVTPLCGTTK